MDEAVAAGAHHALRNFFRNLPPSSIEDAARFAATTLNQPIPREVNVPATIARWLAEHGPNDRVRNALAERLHAWDHQPEAGWAGSAPPYSAARRLTCLQRLGFNETQAVAVNEAIPAFTPAERTIVIAKEHTPWYGRRKGDLSDFYWGNYRTALEGAWKDEDSVGVLEASVEDVLARLSDPMGDEIYPTKGLVMGYVQSGKTSHFTGLIAKAVDAGYRFIIVLAGTLNILRRQTQRRIDKYLVGKELLGTEEYGTDAEWGDFVEHGGRPSALGDLPDWQRLTTSEDDYRSLRQMLTVLEFGRREPSKRFNHPDNLRHASVKLAVIKKTPQRLKRLARDLERLEALRSALVDVPTLVIDDESDQASVNTIDQRKPGTMGKRTSTNKEIGGLLAMLPRAQYVGYTATPFANVFIDPADAADLFPKDYIISLPRPDGYMGVADFFDLDETFENGDYRGNKNAFVRPVVGEDDDHVNLPRAIDAFILSGAIKIYREDASGGSRRYKHHTMLVHKSARVLVQESDRQAVEAVFRGGARYHDSRGMEALRRLYEDDFLPVSRERAPDAPMPASFEELRPFVSRCLTRVLHDKAIRVVNGDERNRDDTPAFDEVPVWAILVGGTKLSRGYTVEGLTISYYRRPTGAGDTLMQMGRWFGFRHGYRDLVRLFLGEAEKKGKTTIDLYEAFGALCRDEEALRDDLRKYSAEGLKPWQVPPLVRQHLPILPPTSKNKMFNAEIRSADFDGRWTEKTLAPSDRTRMENNIRVMATLLDNIKSFGDQRVFEFSNAAGTSRRFAAHCSTLASEAVRAFLASYAWDGGQSPIQLERGFLEKKSYRDWTVIVPIVAGAKRQIGDSAHAIAPIRRSRVATGRFGVYSEPRHREAAAFIAGVDPVWQPSRDLVGTVRSESPVLVLYLVESRNGTEPHPSVGFCIQYPGHRRPQPLVWSVADKTQPEAVVV